VADVIADVLAQLDARGAVELPWLVRHGRGADPLPGAWACCQDPVAMARLLARANRTAALADALGTVAASLPSEVAAAATRARLLESSRQLREDGPSSGWRVTYEHAVANAPRSLRPWLRAAVCDALRARVPSLALADVLPAPPG
jgi:hypothetical protein